MRVLIAGCGYLGLALGSELVRQGHSVIGIRRSSDRNNELTEAGIEPWITDLSHPDFLRPEGHFDGVVFSAAARRGDGPDAYRAIYVDGLRHLVEHLRQDPPNRFVYTGSTGVYGQQDGSVVKETSLTNPTEPTGQVLLEAEKLLLEAVRQSRFPAVILRLAGIYGPDRLHLVHQFIRNEKRLSGTGHQTLNMIHREDAVATVLAALKNGRPGEIYNAVDQEPVTEIHFYTWLAETLGKYVPPFEEAAPAGRPNRKVSNRRLTMELGCRLKYPTFRQGYTAEIKALTDAGLLDVPRESR